MQTLRGDGGTVPTDMELDTKRQQGGGVGFGKVRHLTTKKTLKMVKFKLVWDC